MPLTQSILYTHWSRSLIARLVKGGLGNLPRWSVIAVVVLLCAILGLFIQFFVERSLIESVRGLLGHRLASHRFPQEGPRSTITPAMLAFPVPPTGGSCRQPAARAAEIELCTSVCPTVCKK